MCGRSNTLWPGWKVIFSKQIPFLSGPIPLNFKFNTSDHIQQFCDFFEPLLSIALYISRLRFEVSSIQIRNMLQFSCSWLLDCLVILVRVLVLQRKLSLLHFSTPVLFSVLCGVLGVLFSVLY